MKRRRGSLTHRLILGQALVVTGMTLSIVAAAVLIGPAVFDDHMRRAGHGGQPDVLEHAREAFYSAGLQSIAVGLVVAALGAFVVTLVTTRRLGRWLDALSLGADRVSAGHYEQPVTLVHPSPELGRVADAFNGMAARIESTESRRRALVADVAHELRTPIAAIDVTIEALEDGMLDPDSDTYAILRSQSDRLARLASDIRDVSAAEEGHRQLCRVPASATDLIRRAVSDWSGRFEAAGVTLVSTAHSECRVLVDESRMGQVLDNLLDNALRHTATGGHVDISGAVVNGFVHIAVADDGEGIDASALPHVMERFYRADPARTRTDGSGTGVGLAISRALLRAHDGDLLTHSDGLGKGATFTMVLPSSPNLHRGATGPEAVQGKLEHADPHHP